LGSAAIVSVVSAEAHASLIVLAAELQAMRTLIASWLSESVQFCCPAAQ
jgi:hypothetical protein